jgi:acyl carrier protein
MNERAERIHDWLLAYLAQVVESPVEDIGIDVPFARYGLDSVGMTMMASELMDFLEQEIELDTFFEYPTVESLSHHLAGEARQG